MCETTKTFVKQAHLEYEHLKYRRSLRHFPYLTQIVVYNECSAHPTTDFPQKIIVKPPSILYTQYLGLIASVYPIKCHSPKQLRTASQRS